MGDRQQPEIVFFDLETTVRTRPEEEVAILEFGCMLVCPRKLVELEGSSYHTLVRPHDPSLIPGLDLSNGITRDGIISAPTFSEIADTVYRILNGRIWAGHNIVQHDIPRLRDAFERINREPPESTYVIDTYQLLNSSFGRIRAGDMKMATLAAYFRLGQQKHRCLDDVRLNLQVLKHCATVLFLESSLPDIFTKFLKPEDISISSIAALVPSNPRSPIRIMHGDTEMRIRCDHLKIRYGFSKKFLHNAGRPRLNFVAEASPYLCEVLDACDRLAKRCMGTTNAGGWPVVRRLLGRNVSPDIELHLPTIKEDDRVRWTTEVYQKRSQVSSSTQLLLFSRYDVAELEPLFTPGTILDAYFSLDSYHCRGNAGIRLLAEKLILHSN